MQREGGWRLPLSMKLSLWSLSPRRCPHALALHSCSDLPSAPQRRAQTRGVHALCQVLLAPPPRVSPGRRVGRRWQRGPEMGGTVPGPLGARPEQTPALPSPCLGRGL